VAGVGVLRLGVFTPAGSTRELDIRLRDSVAPTVARQPGLTGLYLARRSAEEAQRAIVSVWASEGDMAAGVEASGLHEIEAEVAASVEILVLALSLQGEPVGDPAVLRIFRGTVREGTLDSYVDVARSGTLADMAAGTGPVALYLAVQASDRFVTVSAWTDWDRIMAATGGNTERPIATRHTEWLLRAQVAHYEVIPTPAAALATRPAAVD
jgi:heme-degrading monooxygenase HmoA